MINDRAETARRNGARSKGPLSTASKARSALNAIRHGLRAKSVILPGLEKASDWEDHVAAVAGSLRPTSYLEEQLVERIALQLWRLRRAARAEQSAALMSAPSRDSLGVDVRSNFECAVDEDDVVAKSAAALKALRALRDARGAEPLADDARISYWASTLASDAAEIDFQDVKDVAKSAGGIRAVISRLAELCGARDGREPDPSAVLEQAIAYAEADAKHLRALHAELELRDAARRIAAVASEQTDLIRRYEVSVERSLFRTLAQLRSERESEPLEGDRVETPLLDPR
jgi:hypothetical protein